MPIVRNSSNNTQIELGKGDVMVGAGMIPYADKGLIVFRPHESTDENDHKVGEMVVHEDPIVLVSELPVTLTFENVESLDVLIRRLQTVRGYMTGELDIEEGEF